MSIAQLLAGDLEHFVLDDVAQVQRLQDQVQRALERDVLAQVDRHRRVARHAFLGQALRIQVEIHLRQAGQVVHDFRQRCVTELQRNRGAELAIDFDLALRAPPQLVLGQPVAANLGQGGPILHIGELVRVVVVRGDRGQVDARQSVEDTALFGLAQVLHVHEAAHLLGIEHQLPDNRLIGGQLRGALGDDFRFAKTLLVHELVELVDHQRELFLNFDLHPPVALDAVHHALVPLVQFDHAGVFGHVLPHVGNLAVQAAKHGALVVGTEARALHRRSSLLEHQQGALGILQLHLLGGVFRLRYLGGEFL